MTAKVALIETKPSRNNYRQLFQDSFEFEQFSLSQDETLKKVLKKDVTLKIDLNEYDWVILVGSEPLKHFTKETAITKFSGRMIGDNILPVINPAIIHFKQEAKATWEQSRDNIIGYVTGSKSVFKPDGDDFVGIEDEEEAYNYLCGVLAQPYSYIGLDTETAGLYPRDGYIIGISISGAPDTGAYINTDCISERIEEKFQEIFNKKVVVFHNAKFDLAMLEYHFNFTFPRFEDTMLMHYMLEETPGTHGLKDLALKYTKYGDYEKPMYDWMDQYRKEHGIKKDDFRWEWIPFDIMKDYAALDAAVTFILYEFFDSYLVKNDRLYGVYKKILIPAVRFLTDAQDWGVPFDIERLEWSRDRMTSKIQEANDMLQAHESVKRFIEITGEFNPNSVKQLRSLLFDYVGLQPTGKTTGTGQNSTDAEVLGILAKEHEIPQLILNVRKQGKIKNTYLDKIIPQLDKDGYLRTNFNLHTTTSGRLSSSGKLNMQQIPRDDPIVKGCIKAKEGYKIVAVDLTTAEMYYAAILSGDENLQDVFRSGGNFHSTIAHKVFNLECEIEEVAELYSGYRQAAKAISFGILYGAGAHKIAEQVKQDGGRMTIREAQEVIDDYFKAFPKLKKWIDANNAFIASNGFVYSFFGRKRRLPNVKEGNPGQVAHEIRSGLNFLVQSVASDINLMGAIDAHNEIKEKKLDAHIFALVHDSILAEVREDLVDEYTEILLRNIQTDRGLTIPGTPIGCDMDVGDDYSFGKFEKQYGSEYNLQAA